jgi:hypothetical protein
MSQFDEPSQRDREWRRARRDAYPAEEGRVPEPLGYINYRQDEEDTGSHLNPEWRRERATQGRQRRATNKAYTSPQEFQLWLQRGGWVAVALIGVLVIGLLAVLLWQNHQTRVVTNPFESEAAQSQSGGESAGGGVAPGAGQEAGAAGAASDADTLTEVFEQPTVTPLPEQPAAAAGGETFVVSGTGTQGLFLRSGAGTDNPTIGTLPEGTEVTKVGEDVPGPNYVWRNVRGTTASGETQEGWVAVDFLQPAP